MFKIPDPELQIDFSVALAEVRTQYLQDALIDMDMARRESPTTNRFYLISDIESGNGPKYEDFRNRIISLTGIKAS